MPGLGSDDDDDCAASVICSSDDGGTEDTEGMVNPGGTATNPGTPWPPPAAAGEGVGEVAASTLPIL